MIKIKKMISLVIKTKLKMTLPMRFKMLTRSTIILHIQLSSKSQNNQQYFRVAS
jgi:hypothetical protein